MTVEADLSEEVDRDGCIIVETLGNLEITGPTRRPEELVIQVRWDRAKLTKELEGGEAVIAVRGDVELAEKRVHHGGVI